MHRLKRLGTLLLMMLTLVGDRLLYGAPMPQAFEAVYSVQSSGTNIAQMTWTLRREADGTQVFEAQTRSVGLFKLIKNETVTESSRWRLHDDLIRPEFYTHERSGGKRDRNISARYDYDKKTVLHQYGDDQWETPIEGRTLDALSYVLALAQGLARGTRRFEFNVVEAQKRKVYHLHVSGTATIQTPHASYDTIVVSRDRMRDNRDMTFWAAQALGYLPVKIVHKEEEGYELSLILERFTTQP